MTEEGQKKKENHLLINNILSEMEKCTEYGTEAEREERRQEERRDLHSSIGADMWQAYI